MKSVGFLILFVINLFGLSCEGKALPQSNETTVIPDSTVRLNWTFAGDPSEASLVWFFTSRRVGSKEEEIAGKYRTRPVHIWLGSLPGVAVELTPPCTTLVLKNVDERYNGIYRFSVQALAGGGEALVELYIAEKPNVTFTCPSHNEVDEGDDFTCVCKGENGSPPAIVTWYKDGVPIGGTRMEENTLTLTSVNETSHGVYKCEARSHTNDSFADKKSIKLIVRQLKKLTVTLSCSSPTTVNEGDDFTCVCRGEGGNPPANVTWFKDGVQIGETRKEEQTLPLSNVSKTASGIYKCVAQSNTLTAEESVKIFFYSTRTTNSLTTMNFGTGENGGTEWYIVVVSLVSGIIIGIIFSYIVWCSHRRWFRNKKPEQYSDPKTSEVDTTYQELDLSKMNKEDNYQSLIVNAVNNDDANGDENDDENDDDSAYTKLSKTRDVENNYQSLT